MTTGFDDLDRALLHALQVDARAPFRRIGEVLGVSDRTVARRYGRLREQRALRVLGVGAPETAAQWLLRVRATPDAAGAVADALAARPDTSWVTLCSGGTEVVATVYGPGVEPLLLETIPRTRQVLDVQAERVLHVFYGGPGRPFSKHGPLTASQVDRLRASVPAPDGPPPVVDDTDRWILRVLRDDGRAGVERPAAASGTSPATVRRRLHALRSGGVLRFDVDVDPHLLELPLRSLVQVTVAPDALDDAGRALAGHAEIAFAAATTGPANLFAAAELAGTADLYRYLSRVLPAAPGVRQVATTAVLRPVKAAVTRYR